MGLSFFQILFNSGDFKFVIKFLNAPMVLLPHEELMLLHAVCSVFA